jgi:hypothetical protein
LSSRTPSLGRCLGGGKPIAPKGDTTEEGIFPFAVYFLVQEGFSPALAGADGRPGEGRAAATSMRREQQS